MATAASIFPFAPQFGSLHAPISDDDIPQAMDDIDPASPWQSATPEGISIAQPGPVGDMLAQMDRWERPSVAETTPGTLAPDAELAACGNIRAVAPFGSWSESQSNCALLGGAGTKKTYWWRFEDLATTGAICVAGLGYTSAKTPDWWGAGCGQSGSVTADWGSVAAYPKVRGMSYGAPLVGYFWS